MLWVNFFFWFDSANVAGGGACSFISICPPNATVRPTSKPFPLPDLYLIFTSLQRLLAGPPRIVPVRSRHCDQHALVPDRDFAQPMHDGDGRERVLPFHLVGDRQHGFQR